MTEQWTSTFLETVKFIFSSITLWDIIDILIIAYLVYKCVVFMHDSRAQFLIKGIAIVVVAYFVAQLAQLNMVSYLIELIVRNGALAAIVIFQPEIRSGLESVGRSRFTMSEIFGHGHDAVWRGEMLSTITAVVESMRQLQIKKMGALVVFEGDLPLSDIVRTGTKIDAMPSAAVITNIFFTKAPLHDGAMIIRNNRVYAAGCILPLTQNTDLPVNVGTRHRAGIGVSENSDATVVVLSEETGQFSVARKSVLHKIETPAELSSELMRILMPEPEENAAKPPFHIRLKNGMLGLLGIDYEDSKKKKEKASDREAGSDE